MSEAADIMDEVATALGRYTYRPIDEAELQTMVLDVLTNTGMLADREVIDGLNRYDLVISRAGVRVVLELKVTGTAPAVERQAQRYAKTDGVDAVAVVTTSQRLARQLITDQGQLGGKPFSVIALRSL